MKESLIGRWHWMRSEVSTLMVIPVVCAIVFFAISESNYIPPERLAGIEGKWVGNPLKARLFPSEGVRVRAGDPLLKVAVIYSQRAAHSWLVTDRGMIGDVWHNEADAGGDREMNSADPEGLARLPDYLNRLPPSEFSANAPNTLIIAFPSHGVWSVRRYRRNSVPKEANDIAKALNLHSSYDGGPVEHW